MATHMENCAIQLERASRETLLRWQNDPEQSQNAADNVKWAIARALAENNFSGFTRNNQAREMVSQLKNEEIIFALLQNMIHLSAYKRMRGGQSLGNPADSFVLLVTDGANKRSIDDIQELLQRGSVIAVGEELAKQRGITLPQNNSADELACSFANNVLDCYVWYNLSYNYVSSEKPIAEPQYRNNTIWFDGVAAENLDTLMRNQQVTKQNNY